MKTRVGTLQFIGRAGGPLDMYVFDDALVVMQAGRASQARLAFGAIGGAVSAVSARRSVGRMRAQVEELGEVSGTKLAAQVEGAELMPLGSIVAACVEKGLAQGRKLKLTRSDGTMRTFRYAENLQPTTEVVAALSSVLGGRLTNALQ